MKQHKKARRVIVLDARREGDRQRLARLIAAIAWRLVRDERAATNSQSGRSVIDSNEQDQQAAER